MSLNNHNLIRPGAHRILYRDVKTAPKQPRQEHTQRSRGCELRENLGLDETLQYRVKPQSRGGACVTRRAEADHVEIVKE
jgi:hypothetical protein